MSRVIMGWLLGLVLGSIVGPATAATTPETVTLKIDERPALELVEQVAIQCRSGISADPATLETLGKPVSLTLDRVPWDRARNLIANTIGLDLSLTGGLLHVMPVSAGHETGRLVMRLHDVGSIINQAHSHDALPIDVTRALADQHSIIDRFPTAPPQPDSEINEVIEIIQRHVEPSSWEAEGVAIEDFNGSVVITTTPDVQAKVLDQLAHLEALARRQCVCRVYRLGGLPAATGTVLTPQEWSALVGKLPPPAAVFVAHNSQHQRHFAGIQRAIIIDADQNQALHQPVTKVISTGLSLSLRPTILSDGVRIETRLWATVDARYSDQAITDAAGQALVIITTPHLTVDQADDLREIPTGGAAIYRFGERSYALTVEVVDLPALKR